MRQDVTSGPADLDVTVSSSAIDRNGPRGRIIEVMTSSQGPKRRHLASSPFKPEPELVVEQYECGDHVSHDVHGMGTVVAVDAQAVTVDFGAQTLRVSTPFSRMEKL